MTFISAHASGIQTGTIGVENFLTSPNSEGIFTLHVDLSNMQSGDYLELRAYQTVLSGGTARVAYLITKQGAQPTDDLIVISKPIPNELTDANALRFSLKQTIGTARAYSWKVLREFPDPWNFSLPGTYTSGQAGGILASRMPTGTVLVGDKTGFYLASPQNFDLIGNISGTITNTLNVINPVGISTGGFINAIADQVWDEQLSGHLSAGSTGEKLNTGGAGADPWLTSLPGGYTPGQAGYILASRMPTGVVVVGQNNDKTGYSLSSPQSFDMVGNISGTMSMVLNVQNPVTAGNVTGSVFGNVNGSVNSVTQPVGIVTGSLILAIADQVWDEAIAGHLSVGSTGKELSDVPTETENADALLKRDMSAVTGEASRSPLNALRFIRNKFSTTTHAGKVTVFKEDDTSEAYQKDVTTDASADPIVEG